MDLFLFVQYLHHLILKTLYKYLEIVHLLQYLFHNWYYLDQNEFHFVIQYQLILYRTTQFQRVFHQLVYNGYSPLRVLLQGNLLETLSLL